VAGGVWHEAQVFCAGCVKAQDAPGDLWQASHPLVRASAWLAGGVWQDWQPDVTPL
jgi:hypothetical protein